jgi:UrcA family protein
MSLSARALVSIASGVALAFVAVTPTTAAAADLSVASKVVRFNDLDIATAKGAEVLYERIVSAAREVCREETYTLVRGCRTRAVSDAVEGVGSALLSSIHRSITDNVEEVVKR